MDACVGVVELSDCIRQATMSVLAAPHDLLSQVIKPTVDDLPPWRNGTRHVIQRLVVRETEIQASWLGSYAVTISICHVDVCCVLMHVQSALNLGDSIPSLSPTSLVGKNYFGINFVKLPAEKAGSTIARRISDELIPWKYQKTKTVVMK